MDLLARAHLPDDEAGFESAGCGADISQPLVGTCRRCGRALPTIARFCGNCGLSLRAIEGTGRAEFNRAMHRGIVLRQRGRAWYRLAVRSFQIARSCRPEAPEPVLEIARTYARAGQPRKARRWYRYLVRQIPDEVEALLEGAATYPRQEHFQRARWLSRAHLRRPEDRIIRAQLDGHLARLTGWQRWWIEQSLWAICQRRSVEPMTRS